MGQLEALLTTWWREDGCPRQPGKSDRDRDRDRERERERQRERDTEREQRQRAGQLITTPDFEVQIGYRHELYYRSEEGVFAFLHSLLHERLFCLAEA